MGAVVLVVVTGIAVIEGCGPSFYPYLVSNGGCDCEEYRVTDGSIEYTFRARYAMHDGVVTQIEIEFRNNSSADTLVLGDGKLKITSRNVAYQYNDKFLPFHDLRIPPHHTDEVNLSGSDIRGLDDWHEIAGERLVVTTRGIRLGEKILKEQQVEFVPVNPKLQR